MALSDLVPRNVSLGSTSVAPGASLSVNWLLANQGTGAANSTSTTELRINQSSTSFAGTNLAGVSTAAPLSAQLSRGFSMGTSDLVPQDLSLGSSSVCAGGSLAVNWTIHNNGPGIATASTTGIRISRSSGDEDTAGNTVKDMSTPQTASDGNDAESTKITVPTTLRATGINLIAVSTAASAAGAWR
jgi:hypothetical protein